MPNPLFYNQFSTNIISYAKDNDIVAIIKGLILKIRYKSFYKRWTEKMVYKTDEFFMDSIKHISSKNLVAFCMIQLALRSFYALENFMML